MSATSLVLPSPRTSVAAFARGAGPLVAWAGLVVAGVLLGRPLFEADPLVRLGNAPLVGYRDWHPSLSHVPALGLAAALVVLAPVAAARMPFRGLLATSWAAGAAWVLVLAASQGWGAVTMPLELPPEYLNDVGRVGEPGAFLAGFTDALPGYSIHVQGHPPGVLLGLWGLAESGLGGPVPFAVLCIVAGASAAPSALVAARNVAGEDAARRAAPFVALAPAALWIGTSADGLFLGVSAAGLALLTGRRAWTALAGGLVLGLGLFLTYGLVPLGLLALVILRRDPRRLVLAALGVVLVAALFALGGFLWWEGLAATRERYLAGVADRRPYADFLVINLAALALALGPAVVAGLARLRDRRLWLLVGGGVAAVLLADLSGMSKGETERIWLPFTPWLLLAAGALRPARPWLAAQLGLALLLEAGIHSPW